MLSVFASRPPYTLYSPSKIQNTAAYHVGMLLTNVTEKRLFTKWSHVVRRNSHSMSSTTSDNVRQIVGQTLVCVSIHLECWLNKPEWKLLLVCSGFSF